MPSESQNQRSIIADSHLVGDDTSVLMLVVNKSTQQCFFLIEVQIDSERKFLRSDHHVDQIREYSKTSILPDSNAVTIHNLSNYTGRADGSLVTFSELNWDEFLKDNDCLYQSWDMSNQAINNLLEVFIDEACCDEQHNNNLLIKINKYFKIIKEVSLGDGGIVDGCWGRFESINSEKYLNMQKNAYKKPFPIDHIADTIENILTTSAIVPILGAVPALLKIIFGIIQALCALLTLVALTFFIPFEPVRELWFHAFRHIVHGLGNMMLGVAQAIPLIGTCIGIYQSSEKTKNLDAKLTFYNSQSHKFFAYKTLEDTSWIKYQAAEAPYEDPAQPITRDLVPGEYMQRLLSL